MDKKNTNIAIVGAGWRTEFFMKVASMTHYNISGVVVRDFEKYQNFSKKWSVNLYDSIESLISEQKLDFIIVAVPSEAVVEVLESIKIFKIPVLLETPVGRSEDMIGDMLTRYDEYSIQVAEQYHLQPLHIVREMLIHEGVIGKVSHAYVSACHGYHGISLMRKFLGINMPKYKLTAFSKKEGLHNKTVRHGRRAQEDYGQHVTAFIDFDEVSGVYDFMDGQYFSPIRESHIMVKGDNGEITDERVVYYNDDNICVTGFIQSHMSGRGGSLEGLDIDYISFNGRLMWTNPYKGMGFSDEEIAIVTSLDKMSDYTESGKSFYSLKEAAYDSKVSLAIERALEDE